MSENENPIWQQENLIREFSCCKKKKCCKKYKSKGYACKKCPKFG